MKKFAVSYINWGDNKLQTKIVEAETNMQALTASGFYDESGMQYIEEANTWELSKQHAFDMDSMFEVVEVV